MIYYVEITRLNGRRDFFELASKLDERGYDESVEYNQGGWMDNQIWTVRPHLRFINEEDALAYVLAYGGNISTHIPVDDKVQDKCE